MIKVLVLSATASATNYIYTLRERSDLDIYVTDVSENAGGLYEEGIGSFVIPRANDLSAYRQALDRIISEEQIDLLIPTSDYDMSGVMELLKRGWDPPVKMFKPEYDAYRVLSDKLLVNQVLAEEGFRVPRVYRSTAEAVCPVVVKPRREAGAKGTMIVEDDAELERSVELVERAYGNDIILQEYIPGGVGSIHVALLLYGADGKVYGEVASRSSLTMMTWGGGGNAGKLVDLPQLLETSKKIVETIGGWRGPINFEYKQHADDGEYYLMEANCRLNGYSYLTTMNGLNFPSAIVELLTSGSTDPISFDDSLSQTNFVLGYRTRVVSA
ncbi:MAG: ATP-grasp domain-containing protein [Verrucomicrobiota bacterium]